MDEKKFSDMPPKENKSDISKSLKPFLFTAAASLLVAILPFWPYGYYTFLRLFILLVVIGCFLKQNTFLKKHLVPLSIIGIIFNPILPIHLDRSYWMSIDLAVSGYFLFLAAKVSK